MSMFGNIHKIASRMIPMESIRYRYAIGKSIDEYGQAKVTFGEWNVGKAHVQPGIISSFGGKNVEEKIYKELGLDFTHVYITIWVDNADITLMVRKDGADQIEVRGRVFNVSNITNWLDFNGWKRIYCEEEQNP